MVLTIEQYIESLTNTDGRLRSVGRLRLMADSDRQPEFTMPGRGLVDFGVVVDDVACTMRCPLRWDDDVPAKLRLLSAKATPGQPDWRVLERELTLFDEMGHAVVVDVLLRATLPPALVKPPTPAALKALETTCEELTWDALWGVATASRDGQWMLLDRDGNLLTTATFEWLGECAEGLILAQRDGKCGFVDARGREVVPFIYDDATSFCAGEALVTAAGKSFFISRPAE